jgi:tetratricopeptide (TPR) repeat protein
MAEAFKASGMAQPAGFDQFNLESLFGRRLPRDVGKPDTPTVEMSPRGKGWVYVRDGKTVVEFTPSERSVPKSYRRSFSHFLIHNCGIHPQLRKHIEADGRIPELLTYRVQDINGSRTISFRLKSVSESKETWESVPKEFTEYIDPKDPLAQVVKQFEKAIKDSTQPTDDGMWQFVKDALRDGKVLDAFLAWHEYFLQSGEGDRDLLRQISEVADEEVRYLITHLGEEEKEGRRLSQTLVSLARRRPQKKYILGVLGANVLVHAGRPQDAIELQKKALEANPHLAAVYYDIGAAYYRDFYMDLCWRCYEMARKLAPKHPVLRQLDDLQTQFEQDFPDDF